MAESRFSIQSQYGLNANWWQNSQDWGGNYTNVRAQCWVHKYSGSGFAGSNGWYVRGDTNVGGVYDLFNSSGSNWSFQNGSNTGDWWYFDGSFNVGHDGNGYGSAWINFEAMFGSNTIGTAAINTGWFGLSRIPKRPSQPGQPQFTNLLPTSLTVSWAGSSDNAGSNIDGYLLRRWEGQDASGSYVDSFENNTSRVVTGLTPGSWYTFAVYAHNGAADAGGYSINSPSATLRMLSGGRVRVGGVYKTAIPYVRVAGAYKLSLPFVRSGGVYKNTL